MSGYSYFVTNYYFIVCIHHSPDKFWQGQGENGPLVCCGGNINQYSHYWINVEVAPKIENRIVISSTAYNDTEYTLKEDTCAYIFTAALFPTAKK